MKRATLLLDDAIYKQAKSQAKKEGKTLKEVINDLLRLALNLSHRPLPHKTFNIPLHKGLAPNAGVDISDRKSLYDMMDDE